MGNLIGIMLLGAALIAVGIFISALTESQMVAAVVSFGVVLFVMLIDTISAAINVEFISKILAKLSFYTRYANFSMGILDFSDLFFFLSITALFLFLAVRVLEKKRWA